MQILYFIPNHCSLVFNYFIPPKKKQNMLWPTIPVEGFLYIIFLLPTWDNVR